MDASHQKINVFILPGQNKNNKYIELLIDSLQSADKRVNVVRVPGDSVLEVFKFVASGNGSGVRNIVHVQWSTILYGSRFFLKSLALIFWNFTLLVLLKTFWNVGIVWTAHNFYAHDYPHPVIDQIGRRFVFAIAHTIIVHEHKTLEMYHRQFPGKKISLVPHGNYIDVYGPMKQRDDRFRESLGFSSSDIVLISLGAIAPYKLNEKIIDAVSEVRAQHPNLKLLIAGKGKPEYVAALRSQALIRGVTDAVVIHDQFVPDQEIPRFLALADYSVFYYDQSEMTSGGIILSLSYGVPVVSRNIPGAEMINGKNGLQFHSDQELVRMLEHMVKEAGSPAAIADRARTQRDSIESITHQTWPRAAEKLIKIYESIG